MEKASIVRFICFFAILIGGLNCEKEYDDRYDNINIDEILESDRLLSNYIGCLMNEKPCTEDGSLLKKTLPDAILTQCEMCTEKQKTASDKIMKFIIDNRSADWDRLEAVYDPSGSYRVQYESEKENAE